MNRRGVALVVAVVVAIGVGAWWLSGLPVEVSAPPAPVVERVEVPAPPPAVPIAPSPEPEPVVVAPPPAPVDAGTTAELEIEVSAGHLVELVSVDGLTVSRPADVMGFARFTVPTGAWRLTSPRTGKLYVLPADPSVRSRSRYWGEEQDRNAPFEVKAPITRLRVSLPWSWRVSGRVVDSHGDPASYAEISWPPYGATNKVFASADGTFTFETREESLQLQAKRGTSRSMMRKVDQTDRYTLLTLEDWTQLKVEATPNKGSRLFVRVQHNDEIVAVGSDDEPMLVPVGHLNVLARRIMLGAVHSAKGAIDAKVGVQNELELELSPTPPITGALRDTSGRPMNDLGVQIREVDANSIALRNDGGVPAVGATTRTNHLGEFSWMPGTTRSPDPLFQVRVVELWRTKPDPVLVKLDDAPLEIVVEPATR